MKIASVSFSHKPEQIGGAHVPAIAFKKWCDILGYDCDLVHFCDGATDLNSYDAVFFATANIPDGLEIKVPYVVMVHAEFDFYESKIIENARSVIVIDKPMEYWHFEKQIFWHPCTLPENLLKGDEVFEKSKRGTLYAARVSTWKNSIMLGALSNIHNFISEYGPVTIMGKANKNSYGSILDQSTSNVIRIDGIFNLRDIQTHAKLNRYFWDVSGNNDYKLKVKRLNLSAFEAMKQGCVPIVDKDAIPPELHSFCIDYRSVMCGHDTNALLENMLLKAQTEYFGYHQVKQQVLKIIEVLK